MKQIINIGNEAQQLSTKNRKAFYFGVCLADIFSFIRVCPCQWSASPIISLGGGKQDYAPPKTPQAVFPCPRVRFLPSNNTIA